MRVYLVEDSDLIRGRLVDMLEELEHVEVVGEAATLRHAVSEVASARPDLILLDLLLPDGCGIAVLREVKRMKRPPLVCVLTNSADDWHRGMCLAMGADYFLDKSTEIEQLLALVRALSASQTVVRSARRRRTTPAGAKR